MRKLGKAALVLAVTVAVVVGVLYVGLPPNETVEEGAADPFLSVRRPVLRFLRSAGLIPDSHFFGDPYLPSRYTTTTSTEGPDGERLRTSRMERDVEHVYQGAFWIVGSRITYRTMDFVEPWSTRRMLRLCYAREGQRFVAGEGTRQNGLLDPGGRRGEVGGFVPRRATGYWVEEVGENGNVRTLNSWGDIGPFWRD